MLKNIKVSRTFATLIIVIVTSVFLLPNIVASLNLRRIDEQNKALRHTYEQELENRVRSIERSIGQLSIRDPNLLACITDAVAMHKRIHPRNSGGIDSVTELNHLNCYRRKIRSIDGIEDLSGLRNLDVSNNQLVSIRPLLPLKHLEFLYLHDNPVRNIEDLQDMPSLKTVSLPAIDNWLCADIVTFIDKAPFKVVNRTSSAMDCVGGSGQFNKVLRLLTRKKAGEQLTRGQEIQVLKYSVNRRKEEYNRKYNDESW